MADVTQRVIQTNGIAMRIAEAGAGPAVILCHGFPESWYSWRHQLPALAAAGYHAVAPDMRGYGGTDAPEPIAAYDIFHLVGDLVGLLDAIEVEQAVVVGHDWGSMAAWSAALFRPDRFRAVVGMSVPFVPRTPLPPTQLMKAMAGDRFMYILYFQEPGKAEAELDPRPQELLRKMLYTISGSAPKERSWNADLPKTARFMDGMVEPEKLPAWLREQDLAYYTSEFSRTGFRGGLNWYRNLDRNWELMAPWAGAKIRVPALFIGGLRDPVVTGLVGGSASVSPLVEGLPANVVDLRRQVLLEGVGHWNQQEAPEATNRALIDFLSELDG